MAQYETGKRLVLQAGLVGTISSYGPLGRDTNPNMRKDYQFKPGLSGNLACRKTGHKLLSTEIRELVDNLRVIERLREKVKNKTELSDE